ncbi:tRNA-i6A37 thiotransferase enzyme MiaB [Nitzschia inconspicua]|uniref:tRNA-i6A37 thiotransferase enzyme MiaB n=1 Tax=Nitzschia inconspicua TaxID=303405 RepID=A0A9K3KP28_9STRA|nr:tRNA-i6A37 thiotransferase enzyme MiaB [Nitzschia inconspicua]
MMAPPKMLQIYVVALFFTSIGFIQSSRAFVPVPSSERTVITSVRKQHQQQQLSSRTSRVRHNVATNDPQLEEKFALTPPSKYPTQRGATVDSRQIIATGAGRQYLTAVRLSHILFASEELADASLHELRTASISFEELAQQISLCSETRDSGGTIGWVTLDDPDGTKNEHLDALFPPKARQQAVQITTKPGDIVLVESLRGFHLVQTVDVMADVRKMAHLKQRRRKKTDTSGGVMSGALSGMFSSNDTGKDLTYKLETMGCQMNLADSERIEGQLQSLGIRPLDSDDVTDPDVVVLNTCSIREHAESKVYSYLGPHAKRKREGEDVAIVVAGCVAQQEGEQLLRRVPEVDLVMGPQYANRLSDFFEDIANGNQVVATEATHIMEDSSKPRRQSKVCAWVNVIYGCNERCAFCIVPTTRGVEQSRPLESIVQEVEELVEQGYKEVTLLGQNIDAYGRDMIPKRKFSDLLRIVGSIPGLERLRFVTSHPRYMSMSVVEEILNTPSVCESIHIPFQSGSNKILASMGRGHTREKYLHIVDRIRSRLPDASITADVIVGFPGETEEDFQDSLRLMEEVKFDSVNTAAYSPRPNTPAAAWENQIPDDVKEDRLQRINLLVKQHAKERRERMVGKTVEVLVEERNVRVPTKVTGRTRHNYIVHFDGDIDALQGELVNVHVDSCGAFYLSGTQV